MSVADLNKTASDDAQVVQVESSTGNILAVTAAGDAPVQITQPLPTGTNSIGQVTVNAGTNLNTSALALQSGVNRDLDTNGSGTISSLGGSVVITVAGASNIYMSIAGAWVATLGLQGDSGDGTWAQLLGKLPFPSGALAAVIGSNVSIKIPCSGYKQIRIISTSYTSGTATVTWNAGAGVGIVEAFNYDASSFQTTANAGTNLNTSALALSATQTSGAQKTQIVNSTGTSFSSLSYNSNTALQVSFLDSHLLDATGRLRVSEVTVLANYCFYQGLQPLYFNNTITGAGTLTFVASSAAASLNLTTASGDSVIYQTKQYWPYSPNISHLANIALTPGAAKANVTQRWGMYDSSDGLGFFQTGSGINIFYRTSTSGSAVDTSVAQASWNVDKLDGTGASGITLDTSKHNQFIINYLWHGAGRVRWGIFYNGTPYYFHMVNFANVSAFPYTRTPKLPLRVEIANTAATASATSLPLVCTSFIQESSAPAVPKYTFSKSSGVTTKSVVAAGTVLLSIQPLATYNGITNRVSISPETVQVFPSTQNILVQIILNATLTGASFTSVNTNSACASDVAATAFSGGTVLAEFYVQSATVETYDLSQFVNTAILSTTIAGAAGDILSVVGFSLGAAVNSTATIQWQEY